MAFKMVIQPFLQKAKIGDTEPSTQEGIVFIRNQCTDDTMFYTAPREEEASENMQ
jgi:hypothetical protein